MCATPEKSPPRPCSSSQPNNLISQSISQPVIQHVRKRMSTRELTQKAKERKGEGGDGDGDGGSGGPT